MSDKQSFNPADAKGIAGGKATSTGATPAKPEDKAKFEKVSADTLNKVAGGKGTTPVGEAHGVGKVTAKPIGAQKIDAKALGTLSGGKGESASPGNTGGGSKSSGNATGATPQKIDSKDLGKVAGGFGVNEQKVKAEVKPINAKADPLSTSNKSFK